MDLFPDAPVGIDALNHLDHAEIREAWPQTLSDLLDIFEAELRHEEISDGRAQRLAQRLVQALASYCGGKQTYLPTGERLATAMRDKRIWHEFTGNNIRELMVKYGLTDRQIYNVLARQRALYKGRVQLRLSGL